MTEMTAASKPHPWLRRLLHAPAWLYRCRCGWLLGWRYDGSAQSRRRLAEQLPLVAFRPAA